MPHQFITLDSFSMSPAEAELALLESLGDFGLTVTERIRSGLESFFVTSERGTRQEWPYPVLLTQMHLTGTCEIDRLRWAKTDPHGTAEIQVPEGLPPIVLGTGPRNSSPLEGPGYLTNDVVGELLGDVLYYRRQAAEASDGRDESHLAFRAYRSYLAACISSVDATVNRLSWFARNSTTVAASDMKLLSQRAMPLDRKLREWIPIVTSGGAIDETGGTWADYAAIKEARNAVVHVNEPDFMFSLKAAADVLNKCRRGVGGLLHEISALLRRNPAPSVLKVLRAPLARFVSVR